MYFMLLCSCFIVTAVKATRHDSYTQTHIFLPGEVTPLFQF